MVTFNVDTLDFVDDEEVRTGDSDEFATRYDSGNDRLEIEDLPNATAGYIPRDVGTDLVGGKYAETVSEGKALADNGTVYDSIQRAVSNASSWVKVGPGYFPESVTIDTAGLTLEGSGARTTIDGGNSVTILVDSSDVSISGLKVTNNGDVDSDIQAGIDVASSGVTVFSVLFESVGHRGISTDSGDTDLILANCKFTNAPGFATSLGGDRSIIANCTFETAGTVGSYGDDYVIAYNTISNIVDDSPGVTQNGNDAVVIGNRIDDGSGVGIIIRGTDCIFANNRISNVAEGISDKGTNTTLDANLTT